MSELSGEVERVLREAGWRPGRMVDTSDWRAAFERVGLRMHDAAEAFLAEFGGLAIEISGPGISVARAPFELDPRLCDGEDDRFAAWSETTGRSIFPIGELDRGRFFLGIDESSEIYLVETWLAGFGRMPEAMGNLVLGVRPVELNFGTGGAVSAGWLKTASTPAPRTA